MALGDGKKCTLLLKNIILKQCILLILLTIQEFIQMWKKTARW